MSAWEPVQDSTGLTVERLPVPGGWLYKVQQSVFGAQGWPVDSVSVTFVPAVDAPGTAEVTVTDEAVDAAWDAYATVRVGAQNAMRAAIEAADRARGLRP